MKIQGLPPLDCFQIFQLKRERILIYTTKILFAFRLTTILCTVYFQLLCSYLLSYLRTYIYSWTIFYRLILFQKNTCIFQISLLYSFIQRIYKFKCFVGAIDKINLSSGEFKPYSWKSFCNTYFNHSNIDLT